MRNVALEISYDGTAYAGWQLQDNAVTVQGVVEEALGKTGVETPRLRVAGRTDAGVHALGQVASFFTASGMTGREYQLALNSLMPFDVRVLRAGDAPPTFHPRFSARKRWYRYLVYNGDTLIPFFRNYALWLARGVDMDLLARYARRIVGRHDFTSFASLEPGEDPVREVYSFEVSKKNDFIIFDVAANGFLRKMVRTFVGTFFELEKQGTGADAITAILRAKDRGEAGSTAYPGGLYLMKVYYESEILG
jgi:tRNA pseudouridine38-40 synthase